MISVRNAGAGRSLLAIAGVILGVSFAGAATRTWTGAADSDWHNAANWTPSDNWPQAGDSVAVSGGHVVLSNSTPLLSSFSIGNATLVFTNWGTTLSADSITVQSGGVLTLPGPFTNTMVSNNIVIECTNLTVDAGGSINGDGGGYAGGRAGLLSGGFTTPASACQRLLPAGWDTDRVCLRDAVLKTARKGQWFGDGCRNLALSLFFIEPGFCDWPSSGQSFAVRDMAFFLRLPNAQYGLIAWRQCVGPVSL